MCTPFFCPLPLGALGVPRWCPCWLVRVREPLAHSRETGPGGLARGGELQLTVDIIDY